MSLRLAEASEARKARLVALRNRKEGKTVDANGYVLRIRARVLEFSHRIFYNSKENGTIIKNRNFDPESRTIKKRTREDDVVMEDTVEKNVEGLAENIIAEDEERRKQDLVRQLTIGWSPILVWLTTGTPLGYIQHRAQTP
jgi:coiled-coil domain-containing protein 12